MSTVTEKSELIQLYLNNYTESDRLGFCKIAQNKYKFQNYKLSDNNVQEEDYIVDKDSNTGVYINSAIEKQECSKELFRVILNNLTLDQLYYIGY